MPRLTAVAFERSLCQDSLRALPLEEEEQGVELCPRFAMGRIDGEDRLKLFDRLGKLFQGGQDHGFVQTRLQVSGIEGQNLIDMVKGFFKMARASQDGGLGMGSGTTVELTSIGYGR